MKLKPFIDIEKFITPFVEGDLITDEPYRILKRIYKKLEIILERYEKAVELRKNENEKKKYG